MGEITEIVRKNIALARRRAGLTQSQLGEKLGLVARSIGKYESGDMDCPYSNLEKMASLFKLEGSWLWFYQDHQGLASQVDDGPPAELLEQVAEQARQQAALYWAQQRRTGTDGQRDVTELETFSQDHGLAWLAMDRKAS